MNAPATEPCPFGEHLKEWRKERGWTQEELAGRAGVTQQAVSRVELGGEPGIDVLTGLARAFKTTVEDLRQRGGLTQPTPPNLTDDLDPRFVAKLSELHLTPADRARVLRFAQWLVASNGTDAPDEAPPQKPSIQVA